MILQINHLSKSFGSHEVLKDLNEHIAPGEKVVIIGPSGSGKSTFLRCLNLMEIPTAGTITFDGIDITNPKTDINQIRQQMGMVFQHFNLFPNMTVLKNITLAPVRTGRMTQAEAEKLAMQLLQRVGLAEKANVYPNQLSGGQKQRIAIVRAHFRIGPGNGWRSAFRYEGAGRRRHDHGGGDPRIGLCPGSGQPGHVHGRRQDRGARHPRGDL